MQCRLERWEGARAASINRQKALQRAPIGRVSSRETFDGAESEEGGYEAVQERAGFVDLFRRASPYLAGHRGRTFVVAVPGEVVANDFALNSTLADVRILHALGVRVVLVLGSDAQINQLAEERDIPAPFVGHHRVTSQEALGIAMQASGRNVARVQAALSKGHKVTELRKHGNDLHGGPTVRVAQGNFIAAKRRGVVHGIDFQETGHVRYVDASAISERLDSDELVLVDNIGYSATGEVLNCNCEEVACAVAVTLHADKVLLLCSGPEAYPRREDGGMIKWLPLSEARQYLFGKEKPRSHVYASLEEAEASADFSSESASGENNALQQAWLGSEEYEQWAVQGTSLKLSTAVFSCASGVPRSYVLDSLVEGALLLELYTPDGIGCMVSRDLYEGIRNARPSDLKGIQRLLAPLEESGELKPRAEDDLACELPRFVVMQRDQEIIACGSLGLFHKTKMAEIAALVVHPSSRGEGRGDALLQYLEQRALREGMSRIFLLTTRTAEWFIQRGFSHQGAAQSSHWLPAEKVPEVDPNRNSQLFIKEIVDN